MIKLTFHRLIYPPFHFASIDFFKDVGQVVGVRLMLNHKGGRVDKRVGRRVENLLGIGFVEFASSDEAKKVGGVYSNMIKSIFSVYL